MYQELYINDQRVDLSESTQITLNFNSNIFSDITKIITSNSQTIKLPKTLNNLRIMDCADVPTYQSKVRRIYNKALFLRNGIEIFKGSAVLLDVTDTFEIALIWGTLTELISLLNEEKNLNEYLDNAEVLTWDKNHPSSTPNRITTYGYVAYARTDASTIDFIHSNIHPSVSVLHIFDLIQQKSGLKFIFEQPALDFLNDAVILCSSRNNSPSIPSQTTYFTANSPGMFPLKLTLNSSTAAGFRLAEDMLSFGSDMPLKSIDFLLQLNQNPLTATAVIIKSIINGIEKPIHTQYVTGGGGGYNILMSFTVNLSSTTDFKNTNFNINTNDPTMNLVKGNIYITFNYDFSNGTGQVPYPSDYFAPYYNLPKIKIADFIKNICALTGTFATRQPNDAANVVRFINIKTLYKNKSVGLNWTNRLIQRTNMKTVYLDAQNNIFQYKEDDTVNSRGRGEIAVFDETIKPEQELVNLAFAATDSVSGVYERMARILQYDIVKDDNGNVVSHEFNEVQPRILKQEKDFWGDGYWLTFWGLSFAEILPQFYSEFKMIVEKPIVMNCILRLNESDLRQLNFEIPVYFEQFGKYYGIISLQNTDKITKAELIQLN